MTSSVSNIVLLIPLIDLLFPLLLVSNGPQKLNLKFPFALVILTGSVTGSLVYVVISCLAVPLYTILLSQICLMFPRQAISLSQASDFTSAALNTGTSQLVVTTTTGDRPLITFQAVFRFITCLFNDKNKYHR